MRGKKASQAANRRTSAAESVAEELRSTLANEREMHRQQVRNLATEVRRLQTDASRIAADEVARTLKRIEDERRMRGLSDDIANDLLYQKDKFVRNACRYVSMTTGNSPGTALGMVMTWLLDEDFYGPLTSVNLLIKCGLPLDGWVAQNLRVNKHLRRTWAKRRVQEGKPLAISLDRAESEGHEAIHPDYKPEWYPHIEYANGIIVDDDELDDQEAIAGGAQ